jgi:serine/threonine protein phosphatase PrpC
MTPPVSPIQFVRRVVPARGPGQDFAEVMELADGLLLVVADGAGGIAGGWEAGHAAVERMQLESRRRAILTSRDLMGILADLDQTLCGVGQTTAVVALVKPTGISGASVGDSAAWFIGPDEVVDLTGNQERFRLGSGVARPTSFNLRPQPGTLLMASDGLFNYAPSDWICEAARGANMDQAADALVSLVRLKSGALQDDVGIVLARLTK